MFPQIFLFPLLLSRPVTVRSNPVSPPPRTFNTTFDDLPPDTLLVGSNVPTPYDDLQWGRFGVRANRINLQRAHSGSNVAGTSNIGVPTPPPPGNITSDFPSSKVSHFSLHSAYIGCSLDAAALGTGIGLPPGTLPKAAVAQPCDLILQGIKYKSGKTVEQTVKYTGGVTNEALQEFTFGEELEDVVTVRVLYAPGTTVQKVYAFDDVVHTNYYY